MPQVNYATVGDLATLWRSLTAAEQPKATQLLTIVSSELRKRASDVGRDLDSMVDDDDDYADIAKSVTCDVVARVLMTATDQEPATQFSQAAGGYSVSGTYLVPGGGVFIKKSELARLGLRRQRYGVIEFYDAD